MKYMFREHPWLMAFIAVGIFGPMVGARWEFCVGAMIGSIVCMFYFKLHDILEALRTFNSFKDCQINIHQYPVVLKDPGATQKENQ